MTVKNLITEEQLATLMRDLHPGRVSSRSQGGANLSYLEAWDVKATLIRVFGFAGFSAEVIASDVLEINRNPDAKDRQGKQYTQIEALATATVRLTLHLPLFESEEHGGAIYKRHDVTYTETAAASQKGREVGEVVDFALKTAESDALKRAAIYLGTQFGLSLYNSGSTKEVVGRIVAPGQEWPTGEKKSLTSEQERMLAESLGAKAIEEQTMEHAPVDGDDIRT